MVNVSHENPSPGHSASSEINRLLQISPEDISFSKTKDLLRILLCTAIFLCLKSLFVICLSWL